MELTYRMLQAAEAACLKESLLGLGQYHNEIAENREYIYPTVDVSVSVETIASGIREGNMLARTAWDGDTLAGFCVIGLDRAGRVGELKYLYTAEEYRGMGLGGTLTDWAMETFAKAGMERIDLRVVIGNPAVGFYEKYDFAPRILVMSKKI
ncbi:MAG: GNAT family N-acetyltransferase [Clostridia bacterium]|nr:GNAT family N-acetyltransferase [Clostridia bacterium]MBQ4607892.1 GNAT family N-acetyltransferase [Clostridia bacterium]